MSYRRLSSKRENVGKDAASSVALNIGAQTGQDLTGLCRPGRSDDLSGPLAVVAKAANTPDGFAGARQARPFGLDIFPTLA